MSRHRKVPSQLRHGHAVTEPIDLLTLLTDQGWFEPAITRTRWLDRRRDRTLITRARHDDERLRATTVRGYTLPRHTGRTPDPHLYLTVRQRIYRITPAGDAERWGYRRAEVGAPGGWGWWPTVERARWLLLTRLAFADAHRAGGRVFVPVATV